MTDEFRVKWGNYYKICRLLFCKPSFVAEIKSIQFKWKIDADYDKGVFFYHTPRRIFNKAKKDAKKKRLAFFNALTKQEQASFVKDLLRLLSIFGLGKEWNIYIADIILSSVVDCPALNLNIATTEDNPDRLENKARVVLELNPDTSFTDIKMAFPMIKILQKNLWPSYVKNNFSSASIKNLTLLVKSYASKENGDNDFDIVAKIFDDNGKFIKKSEDKKNVNKIRKIKERMSRMTTFT